MSGLSKEELERIQKNCWKYNVDTERIQKSMEKIKKFEVRDSDVFLLGFPKSGTTWAQEMVWLILNDFDYEGAKVYIDERFPLMEASSFDAASENSNIKVPECHLDSLAFATKLKNPRTIKTHLPVEKLPEQLLNGTKQSKIIYVARNPKDVCVSFFHHSKDLYKMFTGSLEDYSKLFISDLVSLSSYWNYVLYFWKLKNDKQILFIKYEEMKNNMSEVIQKVAKFLGKSVTEEQEIGLMKWLDFDSMKQNSAVNHEKLYSQSGFIRAGKIGGHKEEMTPEIISMFDAWIKESLKDSDYEI